MPVTLGVTVIVGKNRVRGPESSLFSEGFCRGTLRGTHRPPLPPSLPLSLHVCLADVAAARCRRQCGIRGRSFTRVSNPPSFSFSFHSILHSSDRRILPPSFSSLLPSIHPLPTVYGTAHMCVLCFFSSNLFLNKIQTHLKFVRLQFIWGSCEIKLNYNMIPWGIPPLSCLFIDPSAYQRVSF